MCAEPPTRRADVDLGQRREQRDGRERRGRCACRNGGCNASPERKAHEVDAIVTDALGAHEVLGGYPAVVAEYVWARLTAAAVEAAVRPNDRTPVALRNQGVEKALRFGEERRGVAGEEKNPRRASVHVSTTPRRSRGRAVGTALKPAEDDTPLELERPRAPAGAGAERVVVALRKRNHPIRKVRRASGAEDKPRSHNGSRSGCQRKAPLQGRHATASSAGSPAWVRLET